MPPRPVQSALRHHGCPALANRILEPRFRDSSISRRVTLLQPLVDFIRRQRGEVHSGPLITCTSAESPSAQEPSLVATSGGPLARLLAMGHGRRCRRGSRQRRSEPPKACRGRSVHAAFRKAETQSWGRCGAVWRDGGGAPRRSPGIPHVVHPCSSLGGATPRRWESVERTQASSTARPCSHCLSLVLLLRSPCSPLPWYSH